MKKTLRRLSQLVVLSVVVAGGLVGTSTAAQAATVGTPSITYSGVNNPPTADKPQSKLWWNDGSWWANMWTTGSGWSIYRLDRATATWLDTGVRTDSRGTTSSDTLWDGTHLYIASNYVTTGSSVTAQARLYRYSYSLNICFSNKTPDPTGTLLLNRPGNGYLKFHQVKRPSEPVTMRVSRNSR